MKSSSSLSARTAGSLRCLARRWRKARPHKDGWWLWREGGRSRVDRLLLTEDGQCVASDDEWEQATGQPAEHDGWIENYWEGTDTTQEMMPGLWMEAPSDKLIRRDEKDNKYG